MAEDNIGKVIIKLLERRLREAEEAYKSAKQNNAPNLKELEKAFRDAQKNLSQYRQSRGPDRKRLTNKYTDEYYDDVGEWVRSLVKQFPSLMNFFGRAIANGWDANTFLTELYKTDWWKTEAAGKGSKWLERFQLENDPARAPEWTQLVAETKRKIEKAADALYNMKLEDVDLDKLAVRYLRQGWDLYDEEGLRRWLATEFGRQSDPKNPGDVDLEPLEPGGVFVDYERTFRGAVRGFGLKRTEDWFTKTAAALLNPDSGVSEDDVWNELISEAESLYPVFAGRLSKDRTVRDLASGYLGWAASVLELDPESIELDDPAVASALGYADDKGNPTLMPLWDYRKSLRRDPRWQMTDNAHDSYSNLASTFLKSMGAVG